MKSYTNSNSGGRGLKSLPVRLGLVTLILGAGLGLSMPAMAAAPVAGSVIANQASASYTDNTGAAQTSTSNTVQTTVAAVGSYTLTSDSTKTAAAGTTVYMPHTLTNTGNSSDSFTISLPATLTTNQLADLSSIALYADTNFDGQPDGTTPICSVNTAAPAACTSSTGALAPNGTYGFVVALVVKSSATNADVVTEVVTATPANAAIYPTTATATTNGATYGPASEKINTDTVTINNTSAVINMTKAIVGTSSGPFGTVVTYRIDYTNSGNAAGPVYLTDVIGSGATVGSNYIAGSGRWSNPGIGVTPMTDAVDSQANGSQYSATPLPTGLPTPQSEAAIATTITAAIYNVPANGSGYFTYQAVILNSAALGTSTTTNHVSYGTPTTCTIDTTPCTAPTTVTNTNNAPFTVIGVYSVVANNDATTTDGDNATATGKDVVSVATAAPGQTITFNNHIHNTGTSPDTYNITLGSVTAGLTAFPSGTTFALYKSDGTSPLGDTNSDTILDTGVVPAGGDYVVVLKATLPAGATAGGAYTQSVTATSTTVASPTAPSDINTVFDQLGAVVVGNLALAPSGNNQIYPGGTVYYPHTLSNNGNSICGAGTSGTDPSSYSITVTNTLGAANWQYNVYYDVNGNGAVDSGEPLLGGGTSGSTFTTAAGVLPAIAAGTSKALLVKVTSPAGAVSGDIDGISVSVSTNCASVVGIVTSPTVIDTTTVVLGQLRVQKTQAKTVGACTTAPVAASYGSGALSANPGDCLWYKIVATNQGSADVTAVNLNDTTPAFTSYATGVACTSGVGATGTPVATPATPAAGYTGPISCGVWNTVPAGSTVEMDFAVQINQ